MPLSNGEENGDSRKKILFREKEMDILSSFMGPRSCISYSSLFVYGHSSAGKSLVVSELLKDLEYPYIWLNCYESASSQPVLLSSIVNQVASFCRIDCPDHVSNICDLVNFLRQSLENVQQTVYFVFDNAEALKKKHSSILPALMNLQELTGLNVTTIMISEVVWEKFRGSTSLFDPIMIHFSDYTKEQLVDILCLDCPPNSSHDFYENYANIIMKVFFVVTRNLKELRHVAHLNFAKYCEPVESGELSETNVFKLFKNIEPTLKDAIHAVYLREVSGTKWNKLLQENTEVNGGTLISKSTMNAKFQMMKELPFYSKFLLIASYFASYNSPKSDFKHFVKNQGKQKKKKISKVPQKNRHLLGPKYFTLDRMLSIFFSIVGHCVLPSALIFSQISSLCSLQLIALVSKEDQLDTPKYKCLAELDLVRNIGKTVNIDVTSYLDDFNS